jgi:hypothetical protein
MLNKLFSKPISLTIGGQNVNFSSVSEFEFSLAGRTEVPSRKITDLMQMSPDELKKEARNIKNIEKQFVDILSKAMEAPGNISQLLGSIDVKVFSQDHNWRDIMSSLRSKNGDYNEMRRIALVKYMQYLNARQELIKHTYSMKRQVSGKPASMDEEEKADSLKPGAMRETVILDSVILEQPPKQEQSFVRMPKGEPILVPIRPGEVINLLLSKHPFKLRANDNLVLIDAVGNEHPLQDGKNIIGRDNVCNVITPSSLRDISRLHLIIEKLSSDSLRLTDLSAHGSFLPTRYFDIAID